MKQSLCQSPFSEEFRKSLESRDTEKKKKKYPVAVESSKTRLLPDSLNISLRPGNPQPCKHTSFNRPVTPSRQANPRSSQSMHVDIVAPDTPTRACLNKSPCHRDKSTPSLQQPGRVYSYCSKCSKDALLRARVMSHVSPCLDAVDRRRAALRNLICQALSLSLPSARHYPQSSMRQKPSLPTASAHSIQHPWAANSKMLANQLQQNGSFQISKRRPPPQSSPFSYSRFPYFATPAPRY